MDNAVSEKQCSCIYCLSDSELQTINSSPEPDTTPPLESQSNYRSESLSLNSLPPCRQPQQIRLASLSQSCPQEQPLQRSLNPLLSSCPPGPQPTVCAQSNKSLDSLPPERSAAFSQPQPPQQSHALPTTTTTPKSAPSLLTSTNNPPRGDYEIMDEEPAPSMQQVLDASHHSSSCHSGSVAQWFALETTAEDRLSWAIIRDELKDVVYELFHFLKNRHWKKKLLTVTVAVLFVIVVADLMWGHRIHTWLDAFLIWMTDYPAAAEFVFIGIYVLATILFVPPTVLLFGGGWAFAEAWGSIGLGTLAAVLACFTASVISALLSFVRARYMMRDVIELFAQRYPVVKAADQALRRDGLRILLLLRLCPLIPFSGLNYLGGITGVSWEAFVVSLIGILPYQVLVITMGATAGTLHSTAARKAEAADGDEQEEKPNVRQQELQALGMLIVTSVGIATLVIAMILAFRFTKKELQKELQIGEGDMRSYIAAVRRMSMVDLYDSYRNELVETQEGMEVIKAASMAFSTSDEQTSPNNHSSSFATNYYTAMDEQQQQSNNPFSSAADQQQPTSQNSFAATSYAAMDETGGTDGNNSLNNDGRPPPQPSSKPFSITTDQPTANQDNNFSANYKAMDESNEHTMT